MRSSLSYRCRLESASSEDFHHHLHPQPPECSSHILSYCSFALYPLKLLASSLVKHHHTKLKLGPGLVPTARSWFPAPFVKSTQSSLTIPFYWRTTCPYKGVFSASSFAFVIRHDPSSSPIEHYIVLFVILFVAVSS
jgi:hypothetical protein